MKIMMVTPYFYPKIGGLENYALNIALELHKRGNEVFIVTTNHIEHIRKTETVKGLRVIRLPVTFKLSNTPFNPFWYWQLKKIIKSEKPDVINAHTPVPFISDMAVLAASKTPVALTYHNDLVKDNGLGKYLAKIFYLLFINRTLRKSDSIITTSDFYAKNSPYLSKHLNKIKIVPPGIDPQKFNNSIDASMVARKYKNDKLVLFVGNLDKTHSHKGLDVLIRSITEVRKSISNVRLLVVGKGDGVEDYRKIAKQNKVEAHVDFIGYVSDTKLPAYYAGSDVVVLPSKTNAEGFGMVLIEAQACETAVVGTKVGGIPYVIQDKKSGLLVEPDDPRDLSKAILQSMNNPSTIEYAYDYVHQNFTWSTQGEKSNRILSRLILPKVTLIHNIISPYRLPVYEEVNKQVNLTVLFCRSITKDRVWKYDLSKYTFGYEILRGFSVGPIIFNTNVLRVLLRSNFDLLMVNSDPDVAPSAIIGFVLAKIKHKKILIWSLVSNDSVHSFPNIAYSNAIIMRIVRTIFTKIILSYRKFCYRLANHYLAFTLKAESYLLSKGIDKNDITRTHQVMPLELLPEPSRKFKRGGRTFLYVGYFNKRKDVDTLIHAFKLLEDNKASLWLAGTGPTENELKKMAAIDPRIRFFGYVEGQAKADLFAKADIFVLPTLHDVWGLVVNEAIRYGLAVICSDKAEAKEIIETKSGLVFPAQNVIELSKAMTKIIENQKYLADIEEYNIQNNKVTDVTYAANGYVSSMKRALRQYQQ